MYDLHLHTFWSYDATARPQAYIDAAVERGMRCLAITDHHTTDGLSDVLAAAKGSTVRIIPAAELSVTTSVGVIDLLCYNLPLAPSAGLARVYERYHQWQRETGAGVVKAMQHLGYDYTDAQHKELLERYRPPQTLTVQGLTHVQNDRQRDYFIARKFADSAEDYSALMTRVGQTEFLPPHPDVDFVVSAVKNAGALVVIAHPRSYFLQANLQRIKLLHRECHLDGIECAHPRTPLELGMIYREYCIEHQLISTGGSDTHEERNFSANLGKYGQEQWLDELLARL
ncbi:MAG: PHP domain-containing protein [Phycisphaerales bacterium]|nr:PHP domain-containing protein [Phycisphaerales bacterium]